MLCACLCVCVCTHRHTHKNQSQQQAKYCLLLSKTRRNVNEGIFVITLCSAICLSLLLFVELGRTSASNTYIVNVRMKDHVSQTRATSNLLELKWSHYTGYNTDSCVWKEILTSLELLQNTVFYKQLCYTILPNIKLVKSKWWHEIYNTQWRKAFFCGFFLPFLSRGEKIIIQELCRNTTKLCISHYRYKPLNNDHINNYQRMIIIVGQA